MKIKKLILPGLLTIAVVISVVLSSSIWINPAHYETKQSNKVTNGQPAIDNKQISNVYSPTQVIQTDGDSNQYMLTNHSVNLISEIGNQIKHYKNTSYEQTSHNNKLNYMKMLQYKDSILLNYPDKISLKIFSEFLGTSLKSSDNYDINRIIIPLDDSNDIYLLRDSDYSIYKYHFKDTNVDSIKNAIKNNVGQIPITIGLRKNSPFISFDQSFKMPQYGYLINKIQQSYYVNRLLSDSQNFSTRRHRNSIVYGNQSSKQLTFNNNGDASYFDSHSNSISTNFTQFLTDAYKNVAKMNSADNLSNLRYFAYDNKSSSVTYRNYVEGFPIFNQNKYGAIQMKLVDNTSLRYNFSTNSLQIPVPTGRDEIKLPSTKDVFKNLKDRGFDTDKIGSIELGYQWNNSKSSNILVTLQPTWFVSYYGHWENYNQMITKGGY
ncbi:two-component system activity regulator YycH [Apilactobacillus apisilvae]|uniref:Two-component system activity regulator YycH n=1 Tax=Apilactobacillus apisilvae TaxID=2923364 RepID=A0ABY4PFS6_9LACO|nr:two-component system activity regulator YycH [Apilactobacillus apisilvae]UQS84635.1 two-component system activity regulator YycH [Apilactobacillus apisilvae]